MSTIIVCQLCGQDTERTGQCQKYCPYCRPQAKKAWDKEYWPAYVDMRRNDPVYRAERRRIASSYRANNLVQERARERKYRARIRQEVIAAYGGKCTCCGESTPEFLVIDHTNNDGAAHRKEIGAAGGSTIYKWLKKNDYPEGFQVLCHNCNMAKGFYGQCPHSMK